MDLKENLIIEKYVNILEKYEFIQEVSNYFESNCQSFQDIGVR